MAIYTRFGEVVTFTAARFFPVWIEHKPSETKWHYRKPAKVGKKSSVTELPIMFVKATGEGGRLLCDGKWIDVATFVADEGMREISAASVSLYPTANDDYQKWNKGDAPSASEMFSPFEALDLVA